MAKLRIFLCVLLGHRSIVLYSGEQKSGGKKYARYLSKCERCGTPKMDRQEIEP